MKSILQIMGGLMIIFGIADFGLSYIGTNLTPFLPNEISRFSPIAFIGVGSLLLNMNKD